MTRKKQLPRGLFYHPQSQFIYFKIKKWDEKTGTWKWSSPMSSKTTDIAVAMKTKDEAQELSDQITHVAGDTQMSHEAALQMVNRILRWHEVPEIRKRQVPLWSTVRDSYLATQESLSKASESKPGVDSRNTFRVVRSRLRAFGGWLGDSDPRVSDVHREDAQQFYQDQLDSGYAPSTVLACVKVLRGIFEQAKKDGHLERNPWEGLKTVGNQYRQKEPFTLDDIEAIRKGVETLEHPEEWKTVVLFGLVLGARLKDCTLRTWEEIVLQDPPHLIFVPNKTAKRKQVVKAPLVDPLHSRLLELAGDSGGYITPNLAKLDAPELSRRFSGLLREIKVPMREEKGINTWYSKGFHSFRHTLPSLLAANDVPQEIRMAITGHSDSETHHQYTHHEDSRLRGVLEDSMKGVKGW